MPLSYDQKLEKVFSTCHAMIDSYTWNRIVEACGTRSPLNRFPAILQKDPNNLPKYLPDLARLEKALHEIKSKDIEFDLQVDRLKVNPSLQLLELEWKNLTDMLDSNKEIPSAVPQPGREFVLVWKDPKTRKTKFKAAKDEDLLVLKMMVEGVDSATIAAQGALPVTAVDAAVDRAVEKGLLLRPGSRIFREPACFPSYRKTEERFLSSPTFAIQWHITQACDLHCKHCYDRSSRSPLKLNQAIRILDDLYGFCRSKYVKGHVMFTGGNPLLYPDFLALYRLAAERGFITAVLGNPTSRQQIKDLIAIQRPNFFQVSLEGLPEHNDDIRGAGHFERVIKFLRVLRDLDVYSMVMLTLTRDNMDQVLPLAEMLRDHSDAFFFNRLSMVGEGANLQLPTKAEYARFLKSYMDAAEQNPIMGLKDNLFNIMRHEEGMPLFSGCTGFGCGAAFSFLAVLSDGEVHACRKFPSPIGNIFQQTMAEIYESDMARQYRAGCKACNPCIIRPVCGGCLAISHSYGMNVFEERDPHCFMNNYRDGHVRDT